MAPWVRKTTEEYKKYLFKRRFSLALPIMLFFCSFIVIAIARLIDHSGRPISLAELVEFVPSLFIISLSIAAIVYIIQILWRSFRYYPSTMVCDKCNKVMARSNLPDYPHSECPCGGTYVDIRSMKWIQG
jgi:hypothetical protein